LFSRFGGWEMFKRNLCISDFEKSEKGTKECCLNGREMRNEKRETKNEKHHPWTWTWT
jgi:hypothetical protein